MGFTAGDRLRRAADRPAAAAPPTVVVPAPVARRGAVSVLSTSTTGPTGATGESGESGASAVVRPPGSDPLGRAITVQPPGAAPLPTVAPVVAAVTTVPAPLVTSVPVRKVSGVGDSIMYGARTPLAAAIKRATGAPMSIDARVGRPWADGVPVVRKLVTAGALGDVVVVHLGTNGPVDEALVRSLLDQTAAARLVVLVNVRVPKDWEASVNATLAAVGATYANVRLVDWHAASDGRPELLASDGVHLTPEGNIVYVDLVARAIAGS